MERKEIDMAICRSRKDDTIIRFIRPEEMTDAFVEECQNGNIWGVYYRGNTLFYETKDGNIFKL